MTFKIDRDVPPPRRFGVRTGEESPGRPVVYPFSTMEIGESFFISDVTSRVLTNMCSLMKYHSKKGQKRFVRKRVDGGMRFWRVDVFDPKSISIDVQTVEVAAPTAPNVHTATITAIRPGNLHDWYYLTLTVDGGLYPTEHALDYQGAAFLRVLGAAAERSDVKSLDDLPGTRLEVVLEAGKPVRLATGERL